MKKILNTETGLEKTGKIGSTTSSVVALDVLEGTNEIPIEYLMDYDTFKKGMIKGGLPY